jgi:hypothetical protein
MKKVKAEDLKRHMIEQTAGMSPEVFKAYAIIVAKASHADGVYCPREEFVGDASTEELFRRGFLEYDADGNVIVPAIRKLIPTVFVI